MWPKSNYWAADIYKNIIGLNQTTFPDIRVAQVVQSCKPGSEDFSNLWGLLWSQRVKMRPVIGGEKAVLSPQSSILSPQKCCCRNAQKQCFCSQKLDLRHFSRECRGNLNIRTLRIKFRNKSGFEDSPQLVPVWSPLWSSFRIKTVMNVKLWSELSGKCVGNCHSFERTQFSQNTTCLITKVTTLMVLYFVIE